MSGQGGTEALFDEVGRVAVQQGMQGLGMWRNVTACELGHPVTLLVKGIGGQADAPGRSPMGFVRAVQPLPIKGQSLDPQVEQWRRIYPWRSRRPRCLQVFIRRNKRHGILVGPAQVTNRTAIQIAPIKAALP